ncbi:hypothetical protein [Anaeromicrobium sediminis]|uniref:hypothetical protein n=1 Tax=Anaeromicrobium sediminis TaxID=1478221 RepID=UPI0015957E41|nr:hypothetical protein [Anaeromicrobium sediminis]
MFESRCGVCCNSCERKGLNHCGECDIFPCDMLSNMGKEQGYDPSPKIEQCRKWLNE